MKFNKWTLGLAAVGAVSMASVVRADEAKLNAVQTALSDTIISGYVSASANVAIDPNGAKYANSVASNIPLQNGKQDGFSLDVVKLSIAKAQDESPWAAGYQVDLLFGPDAVGWNNSPGSTSSEVAIQQAYVALRTPVGNGIDWKVGVFNTVVGYESFDSANDPNYTRSYGWNVEPTEHTGVLATYKFSDMITASAGVANTLMGGINTRNQSNGGPSGYWQKTVMGDLVFSAPSSMGWAAGSQLYLGAVYGYAGGNNSGYANGNQFNGYVGLTLNTPCKALTVGAALDYVQNLGGGGSSSSHYGPYAYSYSYHSDVAVLGLYSTYKATDKLSLNARGEFIRSMGKYAGSYSYSGTPPVHTSYSGGYHTTGFELTGTVEYDLWANVISRVEVRWDHESTPNYGEYNRSSLGLYANVIYKF
jgi:hypothetical protein